MKNEQKKSSSGIPLAIIVIVLVAVVGAGYYFYNSAKQGNSPTANRPAANSTPQRGPQIPPNAPAGATPPHMLGSPTAAVTVEEFADFQCGSCAAVHPTMKEIQSVYGSKIRLIFRNFPLSGHDKAMDAALAAEAAGMQGKFWAMQDQLFSNQSAWAAPTADAEQLWLSYATKIGLNIPQFQSDMNGMAARNRVESDKARGQAAGVGSTPTIYINGQAVHHTEYTASGLRRLIDAELQKTAAPAQPVVPSNATANSSGQ